jgi:lipopolysaccharide export system protein LptA
MTLRARPLAGRQPWRADWLVLLSGIVMVSALSLKAQRVSEVKGFKFAEPYPAPNQTQIKTMIEGARARPLTNGLTEVFEARAQTFRTNGQAEMKITTPECVHDKESNEIRSPSTLRVETGNQKFLIEGEGFLFQGANSMLFISNRVHSVVMPAFMAGPITDDSRTNFSREKGELQIFSDQFRFNNDAGEALYFGHVRVEGTNLIVTAGSLRVTTKSGKRELDKLSFEENVVMDYGEIHATGEGAVYEVATDQMHLTGSPAWRSGEAQGKGDSLMIERTNRVFLASGNSWLRLPAQNMSSGGMFAPGLASATNTVASSNRFVEIRCDNYEFRTNVAFFRQNVKMLELVDEKPGGKMSCDQMTATFLGTNRLDTLLAERTVIFEQEASRVTGMRAFYTATNGLMEVTGEPTWQNGPRSGRGNRLLASLARGEVLVQENASMRLPAQQMGAVKDPGAAKIISPAKDEFADVFSDQYTVTKQSAHFEKNVRVDHPLMKWACEDVQAQFPADETAEKTIVATTNVVFTLLSDKGQKMDGTCGKAVYNYQARSGRTNETVRLTDHPAMHTTNGIFLNDVILVDRRQKKIFAPGKYLMRGTAPAFTNNLPALRRK